MSDLILDTSEALARKLHLKLNEPYIDVFLRSRFNKASSGDNWSGILSAIQWIQVGEKAINSIEFDLSSHDADAEGFKFYSLVQAVAMVSDAISRLNEIIMNEGSREPFSGKKEIFSDKVKFMNGKDDNQYFRAIRTCFGAHPVTIELYDNLGVKHNFYASWPFLTREVWNNGYDFNIYLWPQKPSDFNGEKQIKFFASIREIKEFIQQRYDYLEVILNYIDEQYEQKLAENRVEIALTPSDYKKKMRILKAESLKRNGYLMDEIEEITIISRCKVSEVGENNIAIIEKYKELSKPIIELIKKELELNNQYKDYESKEMKRIHEFTFPDVDYDKYGRNYFYQKTKLPEQYYSDRNMLLEDYDFPIYDLVEAHSEIEIEKISSVKGLYIMVTAIECIKNFKE